MATSESFAEAPNGEARTRTALMLEGIALRHQIAVLKRSGTRRPRFRPWDRLFWILVSRWWPQWRDSLIIVQPETVLRWRRDGWLALWRYRSRSLLGRADGRLAEAAHARLDPLGAGARTRRSTCGHAKEQG